MTIHSPKQQESLLIVAGFGIYQRGSWHGIENNKFRNMKTTERALERQVEFACELWKDGVYDVLCFSGGFSRPAVYASDPSICNSESQGMLQLATDRGWLAKDSPVLLDEHSLDSHGNVLNPTVIFRDELGCWPKRTGLISFAHKGPRFAVMSNAIHIREFEFIGIGDLSTDDLVRNLHHEATNVGLLFNKNGDLIDPLLQGQRFREKRDARTTPAKHPKQTSLIHAEVLESIAQIREPGDWKSLTYPWTYWNYDIGKFSDRSRGDGDDFILLEKGTLQGSRPFAVAH